MFSRVDRGDDSFYKLDAQPQRITSGLSVGLGRRLILSLRKGETTCSVSWIGEMTDTVGWREETTFVSCIAEKGRGDNS